MWAHERHAGWGLRPMQRCTMSPGMAQAMLQPKRVSISGCQHCLRGSKTYQLQAASRLPPLQILHFHPHPMCPMCPEAQKCGPLHKQVSLSGAQNHSPSCSTPCRPGSHHTLSRTRRQGKASTLHARPPSPNLQTLKCQGHYLKMHLMTIRTWRKQGECGWQSTIHQHHLKTLMVLSTYSWPRAPKWGT